MIQSHPNPRSLCDELESEILSLTDTDWKRLRMIADLRAGGLSLGNAEDLLQEAISSFLTGRRKKPSGVNFVVFLSNAMKSIASNDRTSKASEFSSSFLPLDADCDTENSPEEDDDEEFESLREAEIERKYKRVYAHFEGDEEVQCILMGKEDGWSRAQIIEKWELAPKTYDTALKRLYRGIKKAFSESEGDNG